MLSRALKGSQGLSRALKGSQGLLRVLKGSSGLSRALKSSQGFSRALKGSQGLSRALKGSKRLSISKARAFETLKEVKRKIFTKGNKNFQQTGRGKKTNFFSKKNINFR